MTNEKRHMEIVEGGRDQQKSLIWENIKTDKVAVADRLRSMIVNGKRLADNEIFALTSYSLANDLNPFNNEAYFLPGVGPVPGIAGYRKKSKMALKQEAKEANVRAPYFIENYRLIEDPLEGGHNYDAGDICYECTIQDNVSLQGHAEILSEAMAKLVKAGVDVEQAYSAAVKIAGPSPTWTGVGIVWHDEDFGKKEKYSRHERAMKRAAKLAIKKRWPSLDIPADTIDADVDDDLITTILPEKRLPRTGLTEEQILNDMGIEQKKKPEFEVEGEFRDADEQKEQEAYQDETSETLEEVAPDQTYETEKPGATEPPSSVAELYSWCTRGDIPYVGIKDAREAIKDHDGDLHKAWDVIVGLSRERLGEKKSDQPSLI